MTVESPGAAFQDVAPGQAGLNTAVQAPSMSRSAEGPHPMRYKGIDPRLFTTARASNEAPSALRRSRTVSSTTRIVIAKERWLLAQASAHVAISKASADGRKRLRSETAIEVWSSAYFLVTKNCYCR
jgi:hypothetical protein